MNGKTDQNGILPYLFCCKRKSLLARASHTWSRRSQAPGWARATYQWGLRLGVLPCSRGGRVVHEQIEGGVDGVFVHAASALRGLQAWKNHSWVRHASPGSGGLKAVCSREKSKNCQGVPFKFVRRNRMEVPSAKCCEDPRSRPSPGGPHLTPTLPAGPGTLASAFSSGRGLGSHLGRGEAEMKGVCLLL